MADKDLDKDSKVKNIASGDNLMKSLNTSNNSIFTRKLLIALVIAVLVGGISGYLLAKRGGIANIETGESLNSSSISKGTVVGSENTKIFKDTATGVLKGGGIDGEGQFHLVRPGGDSQNVYLTSSTLDLSKFIGKKITVFGETQKAEHAGWLMDVGRLKVL